MKILLKRMNLSTTKKETKHRATFALVTFVLIILLSACGEQDARSTPDYFVPPTLNPQIPTATVESPETPTPEPTDAGPCENDLEFLDDITIPDNTVVAPGEEIVKTWLVKNSGTCNWESDYTLRNTGGLPMGIATIQALYPARSGSEVELTLTFIAPTDEGEAISKWQAHDPEGNPFGQEFYMQVYVDPTLSN